jgi:hypothetical protein
LSFPLMGECRPFALNTMTDNIPFILFHVTIYFTLLLLSLPLIFELVDQVLFLIFFSLLT